MRGKCDFQAAALVVLNVRAEFKASGSLLTRDGCEEVVARRAEGQKGWRVDTTKTLCSSDRRQQLGTFGINNEQQARE